MDFRVFIDFRQKIGIKLAFLPQPCSMIFLLLMKESKIYVYYALFAHFRVPLIVSLFFWYWKVMKHNLTTADFALIWGIKTIGSFCESPWKKIMPQKKKKNYSNTLLKDYEDSNPYPNTIVWTSHNQCNSRTSERTMIFCDLEEKVNWRFMLNFSPEF